MAFNKNKAMDAARRFVDKGQTDKAIKEYLRVVEHDPKDVRVWLKIGDLYAKRGAKQDATDTYLKVAKFYSEQGFYLKAVAVYKQILKLDPRLVEVNLKLAELYRQLGLLSDAMQHFERVAGFFHREGKTKEALATIRQLVDLDPDNVATRIKLAELYSKEEMTKEAITEFRHACDYLRQHNRQDDFIKVAERLLWHDANDSALNRELATLYLRRSDPRRALQKLQTCFKADPRDVETLALLAQAFQALDQKSKTVSVLKELARILTENGQREQSLEVHRKILMYVPDDPDSLAATGQRAGTPAASSTPPSRPAPQPSVPSPRVMTPEPPPPSRVGLGTGEMSAYRPAAPHNPTGSLPIIDSEPEPDLEPEIETEDAFAADIAIDEESFEVSSVTGEAHADEIVKILTETDVYVKYGLAQKALDHIQRVFELDPQNVEARERLKEIYVSLSRHADAAGELVKLADLVAPQDPERATDYLIEAQLLDPGNARVADIASRHRLDLGAELALDAPVEVDGDLSDGIEVSPDDLGAGGVAPVDDDELAFDDFEFSSGREPSTQRPESEFEFELDDYGGGAATYQARPSTTGESTMEVSVDEVMEEVRLDDAVEDADELDFGLAAPAPDGTQELRVDDLEFEELSQVQEIHDDDDELGLGAPGPVTLPDPSVLDAEPLDDFELPADVPAAAIALETAPGPAPTESDAMSGSGNLEDDLDEADFFVSQGLFDEARDILRGLLRSYPNHPLILAKMQDIDAMEAGEAPPPLEEEPVRAATPEPGKPSVMLEKPVDDEDADTHFDLGLAYKEMGLYEEAIKAFNKVIQRPERAIECHIMIGLCHREQGALGEAVHQFKSGLYVEDITDPQKMTLYYEIGSVYEQMEDPGEALYYFEMVLKKDPRHRDVAERVTRLKASANGKGAKKKADAGLDDLDAFDALAPGRR